MTETQPFTQINNLSSIDFLARRLNRSPREIEQAVRRANIPVLMLNDVPHLNRDGIVALHDALDAATMPPWANTPGDPESWEVSR